MKALFLDFWWTVVKPKERDFEHKLFEERVSKIHSLTLAPLEKIKEAVKKIKDLREEVYPRELTLKETGDFISSAIGVKKDGIGEIFKETIRNIDAVLLPGVEEILKDAKKTGVKTGIISNTPYGDVEREFLRRFNLTEYLDFIVFSIDVGIRKPEREIFLHAIDMADVKPSYSWHIGDRMDIDVYGAKISGMRAGFVYTGPEMGERLIEPDVEGENLVEIKNKLKRGGIL